jgi:hypothetical protein
MKTSEIRRIFGFPRRHIRLPNEALDYTQTSANNLTHLGYPELAVVSFFLRAPNLDRWQAGQGLEFPNLCCVCGQAATILLPAFIRTGPLGLGQRRILEAVPHCPIHGQTREAKILASVNRVFPLAVNITLAGLHEPFLLETSRLNQTGDALPPWRVFPDLKPELVPFQQGDNAWWFERAWQPFWEGMTAVEKDRYLERWQAPTDWLVSSLE